MNKNEFLNKLGKKLSILEESEKKDIIDEYKDILEEKIKHGKTEKEAVRDFGNIDELVKEILKAYKINPKNSTDKVKELLDTGEEFIKDNAKKLSESTDKLIKNISKEKSNNIIQNIFQIVVKVISVFAIMVILLVTFEIIVGIGKDVIDSMFGIGNLFSFLVKTIVYLLFIIIFILFIYFIFKGNLSNENKNIVKDSKKLKQDDIIEDKEINSKEFENKCNSTFSMVVLVLLKLFIILVFIIPLWIIIIIGFVVFGILIYYLIKGINLIGFAIIVLGGLLFLIECSNLIYNGLFNKIKIHLFNIIIGIILIVSGIIMSIVFITRINYINKAPNIDTKLKEYNFNISNPTKFDIDNGKNKVEIDNSLKDGEVKVEVSYAYDFIEIGKFEFIDEEGDKKINFYTKRLINGRKLYDMVIDNLKNNKFYDYNSLFDNYIKIRCNENTKRLVIIDD